MTGHRDRSDTAPTDNKRGFKCPALLQYLAVASASKEHGGNGSKSSGSSDPQQPVLVRSKYARHVRHGSHDLGTTSPPSGVQSPEQSAITNSEGSSASGPPPPPRTGRPPRDFIRSAPSTPRPSSPLSLADPMLSGRSDASLFPGNRSDAGDRGKSPLHPRTMGTESSLVISRYSPSPPDQMRQPSLAEALSPPVISGALSPSSDGLTGLSSRSSVGVPLARRPAVPTASIPITARADSAPSRRLPSSSPAGGSEAQRPATVSPRFAAEAVAPSPSASATTVPAQPSTAGTSGAPASQAVMLPSEAGINVFDFLVEDPEPDEISDGADVYLTEMPPSSLGERKLNQLQALGSDP